MKSIIAAAALMAALGIQSAALADGISVIVTGATWHAGDGSTERHALNSWQHTIGLDYTNGPWFVQASHMTDSFYCSANEIAAGGRYSMESGSAWDTGLFIGVTAVARCGEWHTWDMRTGVDHISTVRTHFFSPLAGAYMMLGRGIRIEALFVPTIPWSGLLQDHTPLVYAQLEIELL